MTAGSGNVPFHWTTSPIIFLLIPVIITIKVGGAYTLCKGVRGAPLFALAAAPASIGIHWLSSLHRRGIHAEAQSGVSEKQHAATESKRLSKKNIIKTYSSGMKLLDFPISRSPCGTCHCHFSQRGIFGQNFKSPRGFNIWGGMHWGGYRVDKNYGREKLR